MTTSTHTNHFDRSETTITYDGALQGATLTKGTIGGQQPEVWHEWSFEGTVYDTPADEATVVESVGEALQEPTSALMQATSALVFNRGDVTYTSQVLLAMAAAYAKECEGGEGVDPVVKVLQEAARRVAVIEALTI